jgi:hypothetical protein
MLQDLELINTHRIEMIQNIDIIEAVSESYNLNLVDGLKRYLKLGDSINYLFERLQDCVNGIEENIGQVIKLMDIEKSRFEVFISIYKDITADKLKKVTIAIDDNPKLMKDLGYKLDTLETLLKVQHQIDLMEDKDYHQAELQTYRLDRVIYKIIYKVINKMLKDDEIIGKITDKIDSVKQFVNFHNTLLLSFKN